MTWKDGIKKDFKSERGEDIDNLFSSAKELYRFLDYRAKRTKKTFERLDRKRNLSPEEQDFKKKAKKENEDINNLMFDFTILLRDFKDMKRTIEETVKAENRVD
jgi:predicted  nucleic acid-binding Zn-ribbon protein